MKRLFDIVASGLGLVVLSPLFLIIAIWIKLDSKGPVFYRQVRVGFKNKDFKIFKFRSMRVDAENGATAGKTDLAKRAKALDLDAIHDTVHEMARDEARHGKAFKGLLDRYFN